MYVFEQTTAQGFYPSMFGSVHGEDIAYLLGMPLVGGTYHLVHNYTDQEVALSELLMVFLVNFAKTGSPGSHVYRGAGLAGTTVTWPRYESSSRAHLALGPEPRLASHYRADRLAVWNSIIPEFLRTSNTSRSGTPTPPSSPGHYPGLLDRGGAFVDISDKDKSGEEVTKLDVSVPTSIIITIGLIFLMFNLLACAGVYYQKEKVKRREVQLERRIKRMSDAGFVLEEEGGTHQPGLVVDNNVEREFSVVGGAKQPRPHFQLRSNSVREPQADQQNKVVLKSALKKPTASAEALTENCRDGACLLYTDQTFVDAAYPRQAKSIPNLTEGRGDRERTGSVRQLGSACSAATLEKERRRGADELVSYHGPGYDSLAGGGQDERRQAGQQGKFSSLAASLLRGGGFKREGKPPSPILELVPAPHPPLNTYSFPARPRPVHPDPIYVSPTRPAYGIKVRFLFFS